MMLSQTINKPGEIPLVDVAVIAHHIPLAPEALGLQFRLYLQESGVTPEQKKEIQYKICQAIKYYTSINRTWNSIKISEDEILFNWFRQFCPELIINIDGKWILSNNKLFPLKVYLALYDPNLTVRKYYIKVPNDDPVDDQDDDQDDGISCRRKFKTVRKELSVGRDASWEHPILHETAHQFSVKDQKVFELIWGNPKFRPFFDTPVYTDKYGSGSKTAIQRLNDHKSKFFANKDIMEKMNRWGIEWVWNASENPEDIDINDPKFGRFVVVKPE
jgi:hypothetical protein